MAKSLARARANLRYRSKPQTERYNNSATQLNVSIAAHRKALVRLLTSYSCHGCPTMG
ncbi:hypothetical protein ARMSODRAFT_954490 [Armillaria solidipes]|uniref:Uncharacterized protein n=1 Tax=Armillaria solidipes TaxID=1076256 RepID=A0A2H3C4D9_9AGAR|nr:hypothetical protein ARMSODRAFT_954490 [Armillaria solidipes]